MSNCQYIISDKKHGTHKRYALIEPTDYKKAKELEGPVAKASLREFSNIRINRYRPDKPFPYFDFMNLYQ